MDKSAKILVLCGGTSTEREVSIRSGNGVFSALKKLGYENAVLFDLNENNLFEIANIKPDMVYIALHGKGGEDGTVQGLLELLNIPYTGPGVASSSMCMNKILTKEMLNFANIPSADFLTIDREDYSTLEEIKSKIMEDMNIPFVLKAPNQGSSIGVVIVKDEKDIIDGLNEVFKYDKEILIEEYLEGPEVTVPVIGNKDIRILPIIEITSENEFYDFESKYTKGMCHHIIPARINEMTYALAKEYALEAYKALDCKGISRIDLIIDKKRGPMVMEINTSPGMTEMSLFPDAARADGMSYEELVEKVLDLGYELKK